MKNLFLIFIFLFSSHAFAQQVIGGGGFIVADQSQNSIAANGSSTGGITAIIDGLIVVDQDQSPAFVIDSINPNFDKDLAATSMYESILNNTLIDPALAHGVVSEVLGSSYAQPILEVFDPLNPASVGVVLRPEDRIEYIGPNDFLKLVLEPVINSKPSSDVPLSEVIEGLKIYNY